MSARQTSFSAVFVLNKTKQSILQIIHIRNKTLDAWASSQPRSWTIAKGPNSSPWSFYFLTTSKKLGHWMMHGNRLLENLWSPKLPKLPGDYSAPLNSQLHQCANLCWVIAYDHKALLVANFLKRVLQNIYTMFRTSGNFSIWEFDLQSNILFDAFIFKKTCSKVKAKFLAENLRKPLF